MKGKKKKIMILVFLFFVAVVLFTAFFNSSENQVVVMVNGESIYSDDIEKIYDQLDGTYTRSDVLDDLIDEFVVISKAESMGIVITEQEQTEAVEEFKSNFPDIYETGVEIYGEEEYLESFRMQMLYNKVYNQIVENLLRKDRNNLENQYYTIMKTKGEVPGNMEKNEFLEEYESEFHDYIFDYWITKQREEAIIEVYHNGEK